MTLSVENGNRPALRSLLGKSQVETFATGDKTVFLRWSAGIPTKVGIDALNVGDTVTVNVRADRGSSFEEIAAKAAGIVGDHGVNPTKPTQPLYLFRGTFVSGEAGKVTIDVKGGNRRALHLMIGQGTRQTFTTGDETVFLFWAHRIPTVVDASSLKAGDRIVVRIRAAGGSSLSDGRSDPGEARRRSRAEGAGVEPERQGVTNEPEGAQGAPSAAGRPVSFSAVALSLPWCYSPAALRWRIHRVATAASPSWGRTSARRLYSGTSSCGIVEASR